MVLFTYKLTTNRQDTYVVADLDWPVFASAFLGKVPILSDKPFEAETHFVSSIMLKDHDEDHGLGG